MKEFVEKLIGRLEEAGKYHLELSEANKMDVRESHRHKSFAGVYGNAIEIVKQLAEEMGVSKMENTTWIPCSERLPEEDGKRYIVQKTNGFIDILSFTKDAYKLSRYDFAEYKGKKKQLFYDFDSEYGYVEWECEAWCPLPAPYQPKE